MSEEVAAWIRAVAWRNHHRRTYAETPALYTMCACQLGPCGHCTHGRHRDCAQNASTPSESSATYLADRAGRVLATVWEVGHRHTWTCPCKADGHGGLTPEPEQMALF
jgi:hypothetical protein